MEFIPLAVLAILFWFLVVLPQRRRRQHQLRVIDSLERGHDVVTIGGLYGRVDAVEGDEIRLEIAPGTVVRVDKGAIARRVEPGSDGEHPG